MSNLNNFEIQDISDTIDVDYGNKVFDNQDLQHDFPILDINSFSRQEIFCHNDPLKYAQQYEFQPLHIDMNNQHFVNPHYVKGYIKQDGTYVDGYFRDGDGDTNINRTIEQGGGYMRGNPDGIKENNLGEII